MLRHVLNFFSSGEKMTKRKNFFDSGQSKKKQKKPSTPKKFGNKPVKMNESFTQNSGKKPKETFKKLLTWQMVSPRRNRKKISNFSKNGFFFDFLSSQEK